MKLTAAFLLVFTISFAYGQKESQVITKEKTEKPKKTPQVGGVEVKTEIRAVRVNTEIEGKSKAKGVKAQPIEKKKVVVTPKTSNNNK